MHGLAVPFDESQACAQQRGRMLVSCPEHLTILKLKAEEEGRGTGKGDKDALDLIHLWENGLSDFEKPELLTLALKDSQWTRLGGEIFADKRLTEMACGGNGWEGQGVARKAARTSRARQERRDTMIVNVWAEAPQGSTELQPLARAHGWKNLPLCANDVRIAWQKSPADTLDGTVLRRHLPSRQYSAVVPSFEALIVALAWEAHEWVAIEAWRAQRK